MLCNIFFFFFFLLLIFNYVFLRFFFLLLQCIVHQVASWCLSLRFIYSICITHFFFDSYFDVTRTNWKSFTHSHNLTLRSMILSHRTKMRAFKFLFDAFKVHTIRWKCHTKKCMLPMWYGGCFYCFSLMLLLLLLAL